MRCGFLRGRGGHSRWLRVKTRVARVGSTAGGDAKLTVCPCIVPGPLDLHTLCSPTRRFWRQVYFQRSERPSLIRQNCENGPHNPASSHLGRDTLSPSSTLCSLGWAACCFCSHICWLKETLCGREELTEVCFKMLSLWSFSLSSWSLEKLSY